MVKYLAFGLVSIGVAVASVASANPISAPSALAVTNSGDGIVGTVEQSATTKKKKKKATGAGSGSDQRGS
jgi:hypothetical protein